MTIDWSKPLEAVKIGTDIVVPVTLAPYRLGQIVDRYTNECPDDATTNKGWFEDGTDWCAGNGWRIRNRQPATPAISAEVVGRMVDLVRRMAATEAYADTGWAIDARSIAALLPVEDGDLVEARRIAFNVTGYDFTLGDSDNSEAVKSALAALKRGRELERNGK